MKIYHYTSIETLALIVQNKTIRFNRLDFVDDCEESLYGSGPTNIKLGQYTFVSCWTKDSKENLSLWKMYTNNKGVRIGLDEDMFITHKINDKFKSYFSKPIDFLGNAMVSAFINEAKLYDISYVQNLESEMNNLIEKVGETGAGFKTDRIGLFKREEWSFQKECRFKINVMPINPFLINDTKIKTDFDLIFKLMEALGPSIAINTPINISYIDVPLNANKLDYIEVMMGPLTTKGERIIVEHLLTQFSHATIIDSFFNGKIRK